jgi:hypothetical protein
MRRGVVADDEKGTRGRDSGDVERPRAWGEIGLIPNRDAVARASLARSGLPVAGVWRRPVVGAGKTAFARGGREGARARMSAEEAVG